MNMNTTYFYKVWKDLQLVLREHCGSGRGVRSGHFAELYHLHNDSFFMYFYV